MNKENSAHLEAVPANCVVSSQALAELAARAAAQRPCPHGGVILAATPLGHPLDASIRLLDALGSCDIIAAEDTRRTRALAENLGVSITGQVVSNFDHNEAERAGWLVEQAAMGKRVLVVTDAGMPSVSDPGFPVVVAAWEAGVEVTCLPGPSAVPTALALSGMGVGHFAFWGFVPRKAGAKREFLVRAAGVGVAVCCFESPHRIADTLLVAAEVLGGDVQAAVCRELTKKFEEVRRGSLEELAAWASEGVKGEIVLVIDAVSSQPQNLTLEQGVERMATLIEAGARVKDAAGEVARESGLNKKDLYNAFVK